MLLKVLLETMLLILVLHDVCHSCIFTDFHYKLVLQITNKSTLQVTQKIFIATMQFFMMFPTSLTSSK